MAKKRKKKDVVFRSMRDYLDFVDGKKEGEIDEKKYPPEMVKRMKRDKYYRMGVEAAEKAIQQAEKLKENAKRVRRRERALGRPGRGGSLPQLSLTVA